MNVQTCRFVFLLFGLLGVISFSNGALAAPVTYDVTWGQIFFGQLPVGTITVDNADPGFASSDVPLLDWSLQHPAGVWTPDDTVLFGTTPTLYFDDISGLPIGFTLYSIDDVAPLGKKALIFQFAVLDGIFAIVDKKGHFLAEGRDPQFSLVPDPVPLPATLPILVTGLAGLSLLRWRRRHWLAQQA